MPLDITPDTEPTEEGEETFDSHQKTQWVISVDAWGAVSVLKHPNIHPGFLEGTNAEEIGIPLKCQTNCQGCTSWNAAFMSTAIGNQTLSMTGASSVKNSCL